MGVLLRNTPELKGEPKSLDILMRSDDSQYHHIRQTHQNLLARPHFPTHAHTESTPLGIQTRQTPVRTDLHLSTTTTHKNTPYTPNTKTDRLCPTFFTALVVASPSRYFKGSHFCHLWNPPPKHQTRRRETGSSQIPPDTLDKARQIMGGNTTTTNKQSNTQTIDYMLALWSAIRFPAPDTVVVPDGIVLHAAGCDRRAQPRQLLYPVAARPQAVHV